MASSHSTTPRIKRFDGSNYLAWKNRVYTELQCEDLTDLVDKKPTDDLRKKSFGSEKKPFTWAQADARARRIIVEHLDDAVLHYAPVDNTAYDIWRKLKTMYNRSSYLQHAYLRRKLSNLQFDSKTELTAFLREFDDVVSEIRSGGGRVARFDDIEAVVTLLAALPSEFSLVTASLGEINDNSPVTLEMLRGILLDFDLKRRDESKAKKVENYERPNTAYLSDTSGESALVSDVKFGQGKRSDQRSDKIHCSYCNRDGHVESRCYKRRRDKRGETKPSGEANIGEGEPRAISFLAECGDGDVRPKKQIMTVEIVFVADSGCTRFMVSSREQFSSCVLLDKPVPITLADSHSTLATHSGTVELTSNRGKRITFTSVLFVPGLRRNLLSVRRIAEKGFSVTFQKSTVMILDGKEIIAEGYVENDLYFMTFDVCPAEANVSETVPTYLQVHRRLGHTGSTALETMRKQGMVNFHGDSKVICEPCIRGKLCQLPYPTSSFRTSRPLEQIVSDVCEAPVVSHDGFKYFVTFLDVFSHFAVVYLLKYKSEVFSKLVEYEAMVRTQFGRGIGSFLCDNGREFINREMTEFCKNKGIRVLTSVAYNHQQNGRAERLNRTLEDKIRTVLEEAGMPKRFWSEALLHSTFSLNRSLTQATGKVPAVVWFGQVIPYHKLRPFGCVCYSHVPKEKRKKLDSRANKGVLVGYAPIEVDLNLSKEESVNVKVPYRQLLGCLLYISIISRPDIAFSVNYFSRFMNCFTEEHFAYLKRVLVYLLHTKELKLTYLAGGKSKILSCFVDADWGSDRFDRKSVSGNVILLFGNVVSWSSKKQGSVSLSSTESEYISLSTFVHDTLTWLLEVLKDFQIRIPEPVIIYEDNQSVICLSQNPLTSKRSKHIDVRFRFLKEMVADNKIKLEYMPTQNQLADGFTKGLVKIKFALFRESLRVV